MASEIILYGPESVPLALATDVGNLANNVTADQAVAGVTGMPQGRYPLGTQFVCQDGRKFRYGSAGGSTLIAGNVLQGAVALTTDRVQNSTASTSTNPYTGTTTPNTAGGVAIGFTHGAATVIANFFAVGFVNVVAAAGSAGGQVYKIAAHVAFASGANTPIDVVNLWPGHKIRVTIPDTASCIDLVQHFYSRMIQLPATLQTQPVCGVAVTPLTGATGRGNFGFVQTRGPCGVLTDGSTVVLGQPAIISTTAGAVALVTTTNIITSQIIGNFMRIGGSAGWSVVNLTIDG